MKYLLITLVLIFSSCCVCKYPENSKQFKPGISLTPSTPTAPYIYHEYLDNEAYASIDYRKQIENAVKCSTGNTAYFLYSSSQDRLRMRFSEYQMNFVNGKRYNLWIDTIADLEGTKIKDWYLVESGCADTMKITIR